MRSPLHWIIQTGFQWILSKIQQLIFHHENSFKHPTKKIHSWTYIPLYDSRPYVFYRNGESFQPEVSDQSQADWFHQWCQLSLCLHHFLPRDSEEHRQQRDLSGGPCSNVERPVGFLKNHHHCVISVKFQKICSGPRRIWERFARPRHLYQKTWPKFFKVCWENPT